MIKIRFISQNFVTRFFTILTTASFAFIQTSYALSDSGQEFAPSSISPDAYQSISTFFKNPPDLSIQRYNQQLLEVNIGTRNFFASNDGRYIYAGTVIDTQQKIDLSEQVAQKKRVNLLDKLKNENQLIFPATIKELFSVTLFTDIDCGYCRRFHGNMAQYNALGIRVNYVMLPRAGKNSSSYDKTAAVLCSLKPQESMTFAMQGTFSTPSTSASKACQRNLDEQMLLAAEFGISATPTMLLPNGVVIQGVLTPEQLLAQLHQSISSK
jgi:thiol:disulfide interchange protein DsbC